MRWGKEKIQVYQTILVLVIALLFVFWYWRLAACLYVAIGLVLISMVSYSVARHVYSLWMNLASVLGWLNTRILLFFVFFLLLTPLALWRRLIGEQKFPMKSDAKLDSYFQEKKGQVTPSDFEKPW